MAERLFQIGIKGIITNPEGKILLLKIGNWGDSKEHWDIPGGRMDNNETFEQTLQRELQEEISCSYVGTPQHLMTVVSNIMIPVESKKVGLLLMAYKVHLANDAKIELMDHELDFDWFGPKEAAKHLAHKYPPEFTSLIAKL